ncbi:hypothetical protein N9L68_02205 [bacterium]|nr:hypothetical protein [bacterium]
MKEIFNINIAVPTVLYCEKNVDKQAFLTTQLQPSVMVTELSELDSDTAANTVNGNPAELLPPCWGADAGIPCVSRTPLSRAFSGNVNCVQQERETTGVAFKVLNAVISRHGPAVLSFECVKQLAQRVGEEPSDSDYILKELRDAGYWAHADELDAREFLSPVPRHRLWWGALKPLKGSHEEIRHFFHRILTAFKSSALIGLDLSHFITLDHDKRESEARAMGIPLQSDFGPRSSKTQKEEYEWKLDHKRLYTAIGLRWPHMPASLTPSTPSYIHWHGMLPREREVAVYCDVAFPPVPALDNNQVYEFFDLNLTLARTVGPHLDENSKPKQGQTPWKRHPPTLVGSGKVVMRAHHPKSGRFEIRILEAFECMRLIGWSDSLWKPLPSHLRTVEFLEVISNAAGNVFCVFHFLPWNLALLSTYGYYVQAHGGDEAEPECEEEDVGINASTESSTQSDSD